MKIYQKRKRLNVAVIFIFFLSLFIGMQLTRIVMADEPAEYGDYLTLAPLVLFIVQHFSTIFCPLFKIKEGQLIKYDLFIKSKSINIDEMESIEKVFGDIHVKSKNKKIVIDRNILDHHDWKKLLNELETKTSLKMDNLRFSGH